MNIRVTIGNPTARRSIEDAIERLLAMLDQMDADPDCEPGNDDEPTLGWPEDFHGSGAGRRISSAAGPDERELEDEHGGDVVDEPHDDIGEDEPFLGWSEKCGQGPRVVGSASALVRAAKELGRD